MGVLFLFLLGFFYGYGRKKRQSDGLGFIGYFVLISSVFLSFLMIDFDAGLVSESIFVLLPAILFLIGYFSGRKMDIF